MSNPIDSRSQSDYNLARFRAFLNKVWAVVSGQPTNLLSYDEIKEKLRIGGPIYRGLRTVRIDQIVGSLNRYHQFDRAFLPVQDDTEERWKSVDRAFYKDINLPPVVLYKVGQVKLMVTVETTLQGGTGLLRGRRTSSRFRRPPAGSSFHRGRSA